MRYIWDVESSWNVMAHGDARERKWRGNLRMEWVASTLHTISERGVPSITTADAHTSTVSSRLNWRPRRFKWTRPFRWKRKSGFCACAITFQTQSTVYRISKHTLMFSIIFSQKSRSSYEITLKNMVEPDRSQMTINYDAYALHAGYVRLQTRTQNM